MRLVANERKEKGRNAGRVNSVAGLWAVESKVDCSIKYKPLPRSFCFYWVLRET